MEKTIDPFTDETDYPPLDIDRMDEVIDCLAEDAEEMKVLSTTGLEQKMTFEKYMHVERFGTDEVQGIELGECFLFPKLDGTNGSLWWNNGLQAGSRNRHLSLDADNAGFYAWALQQKNIDALLSQGGLRLYGEWLVPHSLKTYREEAWRNFYVFDVQGADGQLMPYNVYQPLLEQYGITYITPLCVLRNATYDALLKELDNNRFLIQDGQGAGEGIVLKNYAFQNRFGRQVWAKIVTNSFKEKHVKEMGASVKECKQMVEQEIVDRYVSQHLVNKTYAKITNENDGWNSRYIPRLLQTVYYELVNEEMWNAVKEMKQPTVNFKTLNTLTVMKVKGIRPELF